MFDRRFFLYMALGIVIFALWNAWQADYHKVEVNNTTAEVATVSRQATQVEKEATQAEAAMPTAEVLAPAPEERLIKVHTDVLDIAIDTLGGNIVQAKLLKYPKELHQTTPVTLLSDQQESYYVATSGLVSSQEQKLDDKQAQYRAEKTSYTLQPGEKSLTVRLTSNQGKGIVVNKTFTFVRDKYAIGVNYSIDNKTAKPWNGKFYAQIKRSNFATQHGMFGFNTFTGAAVSSTDKPYEKLTFAHMEKENLSQQSQGGWVAMQQRYFLSAWVPNQTQTYDYYSSFANQIYTIGFANNNISVAPGKEVNIASTLYVGPEITENLKPLAKGLDLTIDYGWLWVISVILFWIMKKIYLVVGNWGWSIILVTVLIKAAFYKLSESSCRSMAKMRELAPKMQAIKERYGDDKQKMSQATMELYRKEKINPLGGCLPMLIQIPFFIALYYVLMGAVELRQAPFIFWIQDLSVHDPYYVLPILMGLAMLLQQKLTPSSPDPTQAKMMLLIPIIFTVFFLSFPSGLVLYWLVNSALSILQQWHINKKICVLHHKH
ncbi:MAG: membrane protein insertase YidC [Gammaproteobacteria bacterium]|nr:membrane protein insertase YidC [Gammaproteobacteria bacterium]